VASLRNRLLTRQAARAMTSPSGILLAGAGAAAGIIVGGPVAIPLAVGLGVAAWAARVAVGIPRGTAVRVSPADLAPPWRGFVEDALDARARFERAVGRTTPGPLRDRLDAVGERIATGVEECWRIARQGDVLVGAVRQVDVADARHQLEALRRASGGRVEPGSSRHRTVQALQAQIASAERLEATARRAHDDLLMLNARLDEAVARAIELSVHAGSVDELNSLGSDVEGVVDDMEALRQGLEEAGRAT
jgi:hypothetical protein